MVHPRERRVDRADAVRTLEADVTDALGRHTFVIQSNNDEQRVYATT